MHRLTKNKVKSYFFYNSYNFFLSLFILFSFWSSNYFYFIKKEKINILVNNIDFFLIFNFFFYPYLVGLKFFKIKSNEFIYFTFWINRFFLNPLLSMFNRTYNLNIKKTFNLLKVAVLLPKKERFKLVFVLNFYQIPLFLNE